MGRAELLLLASAIVIFEIFTLTLTRMQLDIKLNNIEAKFDKFAIAAAKSYLEQMEVYPFDEKVNSDNSLPIGFLMPDSLSPADSLGLDSDDLDEDDLDDFATSGFNDNITIDDSTYFNYTLLCTVYYVGNDLSASSVQTSKKRADVTIQNNFLDHDVQFSRIFSYY
jgi:hypothetical protein